ncbi:MAG: hypothetical protein IPG90_08410 [Bacteroidetes bacterium]|nr:hypothetical protein [Bacteroidota bacterium]
MSIAFKRGLLSYKHVSLYILSGCNRTPSTLVLIDTPASTDTELLSK